MTIQAFDAAGDLVAIGSESMQAVVKGCNRLTVHLAALPLQTPGPDMAAPPGSDLAGVAPPPDMAGCIGGTPDEDQDGRANFCDLCPADPDPTPDGHRRRRAARRVRSRSGDGRQHARCTSICSTRPPATGRATIRSRRATWTSIRWASAPLSASNAMDMMPLLRARAGDDLPDGASRQRRRRQRPLPRHQREPEPGDRRVLRADLEQRRPGQPRHLPGGERRLQASRRCSRSARRSR